MIRALISACTLRGTGRVNVSGRSKRAGSLLSALRTPPRPTLTGSRHAARPPRSILGGPEMAICRERTSASASSRTTARKRDAKLMSSSPSMRIARRE
eukprot:scaffold35432_cov27-Tisochrysis_lutea.AAC.3